MLSDLSPAGQALGLGGSEDEATRKKRLQALQQSRVQIGSSLSGGGLSPAAQYLNYGGVAGLTAS